MEDLTTAQIESRLRRLFGDMLSRGVRRALVGPGLFDAAEGHLGPQHPQATDNEGRPMVLVGSVSFTVDYDLGEWGWLDRDQEGVG